MSRIAIVGGGIAGLSLAHALVRAGDDDDIHVLEADSAAGGHICTEHVDGFVCEHGPNGFLDNAPATLDLVRALGLDGRLQRSDDRARRRYVYRRGALHALPDSPGALLRSRLLGPRGKLRMLAEPFVRTRPGDDETVHTFAARRFGKEAADALAGPFVSGVFGGDAHALSMRACFPTVAEMEAAHGSLIRALAARRRAARDAGGSALGQLTSFRGGLVELVDGLAASLGARLHTRTRVMELEARDTGFRLLLDDGSRIEAETVVLACGPYASARIVNGLDPDLAGDLHRIASPPIAVVCLGYPLAAIGRPLDGFGFLVARGQGVRILGAVWESSLYPGRAPAGHALLRVMAGGATDPDAVAVDDERLLAIVRRDLRETMQVRGEPVLARIFRHRPGIPQYTRGHLDRVARIEARLQSHPGLYLAGNALRGVSMNSLIEDATSLAVRICRRREASAGACASA